MANLINSMKTVSRIKESVREKMAKVQSISTNPEEKQLNELLISKEHKFIVRLNRAILYVIANINESMIEYLEYKCNTGFNDSVNHFAILCWTDLIISF